jgi:hypothetical protein
VANGKRLRTIANVAEPQGLYYDAATNRLFVGCRKDGTTRVLDTITFDLFKTVTFPGNVDNVRYDPHSHPIIIGYGDGSLGFLDGNGNRLDTIPLDAHPEPFQLEKGDTRVFVNVPDQKEIQVADLAKGAPLAKWPVTTALRKFPMAFGREPPPFVDRMAGCRPEC